MRLRCAQRAALALQTHQAGAGHARHWRQGSAISSTDREGGLTIVSSGADLARAYEECRAIAKREAKNFYYSFVALPEPRRNAICAIYAFMRQADDLSDDESIPRGERRRKLD